jgi:NADPH:quinone reductase-like Zn-dependent oxidoreductase
MKAIVFTKHGGPEVLKYTEVAEPRIGHGEILVRVRACALNHLDLWVRNGLPGVQIPMPHIPGSDVAGEVAKVGDGVRRVKVGQKVVLAPGVCCEVCDSCLAGCDNLCRHYTLLGYLKDGGCAEYVRAPEANTLPLPERLTFEEAAAVPLVFLTAWHMLMTRAGVKAGEDVLVLGGGSGVGSAAIQIARLAGARVLATAGSDEKLKKAKELGAEGLINHRRQDIAEEVKKLTQQRGVDVVFEHVGAATWEQSLASLAPAGRLVTCGATTGPEAKIDIRRLFARQWSLLGSYMGTRGELQTVLKLVGQGKLRPVVDRVFPLAEAAAAHAHLEKREQFGKVVLKVE